MTRLAPLLLVTGCFYTDPINQRPSADIVAVSSATVYRGDHIQLDSSTYDPEGQDVTVHWRAYACGDATTLTGCDDAPFYESTDMTAQIDVPSARGDGTPVQALRVILDAADDHGATAKPSQELLMPIADRAPTLALGKSGHGLVIGIPIDLFAKVGDPDDGPAPILASLADPGAWQVFSPPSAPAYTLADLSLQQDPDDPMHLQAGKLFTPMGLGDWDIQVTVYDPLHVQTVEHLPITVVDDHPPCLTSWAPLAPPPGDVLPMSDPTLFEVLVVTDDLDPYPPMPDPVEGQTTFAWSLLPPGGSSRQPLGVIGNNVALDPASYKPGDVLELRVEIQDRKRTPVNCPDTDPTCSVISDPSCIQRLTWRVEVQ